MDGDRGLQQGCNASARARGVGGTEVLATVVGGARALQGHA
jgi:hypothetical protein